jgi:hypothetical protein
VQSSIKFWFAFAWCIMILSIFLLSYVYAFEPLFQSVMYSDASSFTPLQLIFILVALVSCFHLIEHTVSFYFLPIFPTVILGQSSLYGCATCSNTQGDRFRRVPWLLHCVVHVILKFIMTFQQETSHLIFQLSPEN